MNKIYTCQIVEILIRQRNQKQKRCSYSLFKSQKVIKRSRLRYNRIMHILMQLRRSHQASTPANSSYLLLTSVIKATTTKMEESNFIDSKSFTGPMLNIVRFVIIWPSICCTIQQQLSVVQNIYFLIFTLKPKVYVEAIVLHRHG